MLARWEPLARFQSFSDAAVFHPPGSDAPPTINTPQPHTQTDNTNKVANLFGVSLPPASGKYCDRRRFRKPRGSWGFLSRPRTYASLVASLRGRSLEPRRIQKATPTPHSAQTLTSLPSLLGNSSQTCNHPAARRLLCCSFCPRGTDARTTINTP